MFKSAMLSETVLNENGAPSYSSTGDARVDYFSMITRDSSKEMIQSTLEKSWKIDPLDTLKLIFHMRDCRGGNGEKDVFYHSMVWLWGNHSKTFLKNLQHIQPIQIQSTVGKSCFQKGCSCRL